MPDRFDRFTERARGVLTHGQEEAQRLGHNYIGTEHLLLGLLRERDGVGCKVLVHLGVELPKVRAAVEFIVSREPPRRRGDIGLTPRAKRVIELAVEEARRLDHHYIGTEHLLLGMLSEGEGIAFGILESLGVGLERARTATERLLQNPAPEPTSSPTWTGSAPASDAVTEPIRLDELPPAPADGGRLDAALDAVTGAIGAVAAFKAPRFERDLLEALLLPRLTALVEDLHRLSASAADVNAIYRGVTEGLRSVATASAVLSKHGHTGLAGELDAACLAVTRAITPLPDAP